MAVPCRPRHWGHGNAAGSVIACWGIAAGGSWLPLHWSGSGSAHWSRAVCGRPLGGSGARGWGISPSLALARAGRTWLCFRCVLAIWSHMYGKAHRRLVKGFMGGSESVP